MYYVSGTTSGLGNLSITLEDWLDSAGQQLSVTQSQAYFTVVADGNDVALTYYAVPEPATWVILVTGGAMVALRRRRRQR